MTRRDQRDPEAGVTLIELLITIAIMGIAFVALLSALGTAIIISDVHKRQSTAETVLGGWAETLKSTAYAPCPTTEYDYATVMGSSPPAGYTATKSVKWWDGSSANPSSYPTTTCGADHGLEQVTLTIAAQHNVTKTTAILKRTG